MARLLNLGLHLKPKTEVDLKQLEKEWQRDLVSKIGVKSVLHHRDHKLLRTPKVIRQQAVKSVISVLKAHHTRTAKREKMRQMYPSAQTFKGDIKFNPGYKRKNMTSDSISIEKVSLKVMSDSSISLYGDFRVDKHRTPRDGEDSKRFKPHYLFRDIKTVPGLSELPAKKDYLDFKVHYRYGKLFLMLPERRSIDNALPRGLVRDDIVALDPGVRTFITGYSPEGAQVEIGTNAQKVIEKHFRRVARKSSDLTQVQNRVAALRATEQGATRTNKKRQRTWLWKARKSKRGVEERLQNFTRDMHYKASHYLLKRFKRIILPDTSSHRWCEGKTLRVTTKKCVRALGFGGFAERLKQTATRYPDSQIIRGSEAYTSKQCGMCGALHESLGGSKVFVCPKCSSCGDRDVLAARNILLRFLDCTICHGHGCIMCKHISPLQLPTPETTAKL